MSEYADLKARLKLYAGEINDEAAAAINALERERDDAEARAKRLIDALQNILDSYEAASELHTSAADLAANLYDRARATIGKE